MKKYLFFLILFTNKIWALEAVVTVLETPMLKHPSYEAPVVQYLRKGDVIKIHPSLNNTEAYDHMAPAPKKFQKIKEELSNSPEWKEDPLFTGNEKSVNPNTDFIPTRDRQGNRVYVIRDHLYIYYANKKELEQSVISKDPTDYRLQEPLPKKYPLFSPTGYRGQFLVGVTQPYYESYPYLDSVKTKGYMSPVDINITLLRQTPDDKQDRFYFGGTLNVRIFSNSYSFYDQREAKEQGLKIGIGPYITYDAFKGVKDRVNLYGSINVNLFNQLTITQNNGNLSDQRTYRAISIAPRLGVQYHRKQIFEDIDFVLGTAMEIEPATTFRSQNAASQVSWWRRGGSDKFKTRTTFSLAGYLGIQSAY